MKVAILLLFLAIEPNMFAQSSEVNIAFGAIEHQIQSVPDINITYTNTTSLPLVETSPTLSNKDIVKCRLKNRGNLFWFEEKGESASNPQLNYYYQLAYDGKRYQTMDKSRELQIGVSPDFIHPEQLENIPLIAPFLFALPNDCERINAFEVLHNPATWL